MIAGAAKRGGAALLAAALCAGALVIGGCGDDDENGDTIPVPAPNINQEGTETSPPEQAPEQAPGDTTAEPAQPDQPGNGDEGPSGGAQAPGGGTEPEDTPTSDVPPEPGSAQERFEQFCEENPDACR